MRNDGQIYKNISSRSLYSKQLPNYVAWIRSILIAKENDNKFNNYKKRVIRNGNRYMKEF